MAQEILKACKEKLTATKELTFDYSNAPTKITALEKYIGQSGWLKVSHLEIRSFEIEDHIISTCITDNDQIIDDKLAQRFFSIQATVEQSLYISSLISEKINKILQGQILNVVSENSTRNNSFFDTEMDKLDQWADDMKLSLEKEIKDLDAEIKLRKSEAKKMINLEAKVKAQREIKEMEKKRSDKRKHLYEAQDTIDDRKENLLTRIEKRLKQEVNTTELFTIKWKMI